MILQRKTKLPFFSLFVLIGLLVPLALVHAQLLGVFGNIADVFGKAIGAIVAGFMLVIPLVILTISSLILEMAIDPFFMRLPYTSGGVIAIGWPVVRDLANMLLILILVVIALATALRLQQYQARRTLPLLIGVALLINFIPVLMGFVVDFTNILMNFFLEGLVGAQIVTTIFSNVGTLIANDAPNFLNPIQGISFFLKLVAIGGFMIVAAIVFLLFALLFIFRRIAIWILVILSPLALVAYILPGTRKYFNTWLNQFIQWSIVGIPAAFFLWLGDQIIALAASGNFVAAVPAGGGFLQQGVVNVLSEIIPYGIAILFLLIGFFISLTTGVIGASGITKYAKQGMLLAGAMAGKKALTWGKERALESKTAQKAASAAAQAGPPVRPTWGQGQTGVRGWAKRRAAGAVTQAQSPPLLWRSVRAAGAAVGPNLVESERKDARGAETKVAGMTQQSRGAAFRQAEGTGEKIGILNAAIKAGDLRNKDDYKDFGMSPGEMQDTIILLAKKGQRSDLHKTLIRAFPHLAYRLRDAGDTTTAELFDDAVKGLKPSDVPNMSEDALQDEDFQKNVIHPNWDGNYLSNVAQNFPGKVVNSLQKSFEERGGDWFIANNEGKIPLYLAGNAAQDVGFQALEGLTQDKIREKREQLRGTAPPPGPTPGAGRRPAGPGGRGQQPGPQRGPAGPGGPTTQGRPPRRPAGPGGPGSSSP